MKYLLPLLSVLFLLSSCSSSSEETGYEIKGTIVRAPKGTPVYLRDTFTEENIDSTVLVDAQFSFTGTVPYPRRYQVIYDGEFLSHDHTIWVENTTISIEADWEDMNRPVIHGGEQQTLATEVDKALESWDKQNSLPYMDSRLYDLHNDTLLALFDHQADQRIEYWLPLVIDRANSYFGVRALYQYRDLLEKDLLEALLNRMDDEVKASPYGTSLITYVHQKSLQQGDLFEDFEVTNLKGEEMALSSIVGKGKPTLLVFGALGRMRQHQRDIMGAFTLEHKEEVEVAGFVMEHNWERFQADTLWFRGVPLYTDFEKEFSPLVVRYDVLNTPTVYVFDGEGRIRMRTEDYTEEVHDLALALASGDAME